MHPTHHSETRSRIWRVSRPVLLGILVTAAVLLIARIAAPHVVQRYVNNKLDESPMYAGHIGDVDIALLAGAYQIEDVEIVKTESEVPVPLFAATQVEFSLLWRALFNGAVVGEAYMRNPQINIVDSTDESKKQTGAGGQWLQIFEDLFPFKIDKFTIENGQVHFRNFDSEPKIDIFLSELELTAENLANRQAMTDSRIGRVELAGRAMEASDLTLAAAFDPTTENPTFDVNAKLLQLPVREMDNFIRTYAPFDVEAGTVDVVSELAARDGLLQGYVKPIIYDLDVFKWSEDISEDGDNPIRALWEGLVDGVAELLENQPRDQIASNIPLEGDLTQPDTNVFVAVANIFKNAFVQAYEANLENTVQLFIDDEDQSVVSLPPPLGDDELTDGRKDEELEDRTLNGTASTADAEEVEEAAEEEGEESNAAERELAANEPGEAAADAAEEADEEDPFDGEAEDEAEEEELAAQEEEEEAEEATGQR